MTPQYNNQYAERVRVGDLAAALGARVHTLKYYATVGLLPFVQADTRLSRWYDVDECAQRWQVIEELKAQGMSVREICGKFGISYTPSAQVATRCWEYCPTCNARRMAQPAQAGNGTKDN